MFYSLGRHVKYPTWRNKSVTIVAFHFVFPPRKSVTSVTFPRPPPRLHLDPETSPSSHVAFCHAHMEMPLCFFLWAEYVSSRYFRRIIPVEIVFGKFSLLPPMSDTFISFFCPVRISSINHSPETLLSTLHFLLKEISTLKRFLTCSLLGGKLALIYGILVLKSYSKAVFTHI